MNNKKIISSMQAIAMDSINKAEGGHMGMAIGAAPITYSLIGKNLNISKTDPKWINRDRFILSAGHGSMSMYSIMHFMGLLSIDDMKNHKQLHSKTPSHPEIDAFDYVDATTGPLGQGVAMGVGMAISQKYLANKYNKGNSSIIDHNIFVLHGDGCMQEGVALEAIQIAGTLKLNKLVLIHDYNQIQIDSRVEEVNDVNLVKYFESQKFNTIVVKDPKPENIEKAIVESRKSDKPTYIQVHTIIAKNTPKENTPSGHNGVLSPDETIEFKKKLGLDNLEPFKYSNDVYKFGESLWEAKEKHYEQWNKNWKTYSDKYPNEAKELNSIYNKKAPLFNFDNVEFPETNVAIRNHFTPIMKWLQNKPNVLSLSADLVAATKITLGKTLNQGGQHVPLGIREFAMGAIANGIYLHSNIKPIDSTFLAFADYMKPAIRLGALMEVPAIHVFTHDSYQVGGDGPTHQPFDQIPMLRAMSNVTVIRPADESEVKLAFKKAFASKTHQMVIIGCRQPVKSFNLLKDKSELPAAYRIYGKDDFDVTLMATGSEVALAIEIANALEKDKIKIQVLSVPILQDLIQDENLINKLGLSKKPMYVIEATSDSMWFRLSKYNRIDAWLSQGYGYSAPGDIVYSEKGFTVENISKKIKDFIK